MGDLIDSNEEKTVKVFVDTISTEKRAKLGIFCLSFAVMK